MAGYAASEPTLFWRCDKWAFGAIALRQSSERFALNSTFSMALFADDYVPLQSAREREAYRLSRECATNTSR